jgi:hypothetical protein
MLGNSVLIANGGLVRVPGAFNIGVSASSLALVGFNSLTITNGAQLFTGGGTNYIGQANGNGLTNFNNRAWIGGANALWDFGGKNLYVGSASGTGQSTGNVLTVSTGGVVTNLATLVAGWGVSSNNQVVMDGGIIYASSLVVSNAGTIRGTGIVVAAVSVSRNSTLSPGASVGTLTVSSLTLAGTYLVELAAGGAGDKVIVTGTVDLTSATLSVTNLGAVSGSYTVIDKTSAGAVTGAFTGWNEGTTNTVNGVNYTITYTGGDGNDVVLTVPGGGPPSATGYDLWAAGITNGLTNYNQSASNDGYPNLLKYVTGSSPTSSDSLASMSGTRSGGLLALQFNHNLSATDVTLVVEGAYSTTNDATWNGIATNGFGSWGGAANVTENTNVTPAAVTVWDTTAAATNRFLRLRVTRP